MLPIYQVFRTVQLSAIVAAGRGPLGRVSAPSMTGDPQVCPLLGALSQRFIVWRRRWLRNAGAGQHRQGQSGKCPAVVLAKSE